MGNLSTLANLKGYLGKKPDSVSEDELLERLLAASSTFLLGLMERDDALAELTRQEEEIAGRRAVAAGGIDSALVALYEKVRSQNSGLAVLAVRGSTTEPVRLDLSLSEVAAIKAAGPNQILRDEEHGYILVRLDD